MSEEPRSICSVAATLGEGPVWAENALWFVDIKQRQVHRLDPASNELTSWTAPEQVGWVLPREGGGFVAGCKDGLYRFDPATGRFERIVDPEPDLPGNRLNDACSDAQGRLWFGTMDDGEEAASGSVYRADAGGIARVAGGISIVNGPAISPDGRTLYYHDTIGGIIYAAEVAEDGSLGDTRELVRVDPADGHPDGPCVDAEGCIWVGMYGGWGVRRYSPAGDLLKVVPFPVANITKIAFGGPHWRTAYATTARKGLDEGQLQGQPLAGNVFAFDPGVAGQPVTAVRLG